MPKPRGKSKIKVHHTVRTIYDKYKKEIPEEEQVTQKDFLNIMYGFNKAVIHKVLEEAEEVKLPCNMGTVSIKKSKLDVKFNKLKIDWATTNKIGKIVYHLNEHRNGYKYRIYWKKGKVLNSKYYAFIPTRTFKRSLAYILNNKPEMDYWE